MTKTTWRIFKLVTAETALLRVEADPTQTAAIVVKAKTELDCDQTLMRSSLLSQAEFV